MSRNASRNTAASNRMSVGIRYWRLSIMNYCVQGADGGSRFRQSRRMAHPPIGRLPPIQRNFTVHFLDCDRFPIDGGVPRALKEKSSAEDSD